MSLKSHPGVQGANFNINKDGIEPIVNIQFEHAHSQSSVSNRSKQFVSAYVKKSSRKIVGVT